MKRITEKIISMTPTKNLVQLSKEGIASILYRKLCAVMYEKWVALFTLIEQQSKRMAAVESSAMLFPLGFLCYFFIPKWVFLTIIGSEPLCRSAASLILSGILCNVFFLRRIGAIALLGIPLAFSIGFTLSEENYTIIFGNEVNAKHFFVFGIPFFVSTFAFFLEMIGIFVVSKTKNLLAKLPLVGRFFQSPSITEVQKAYQEAIEHAGQAKKADIVRLMREYAPELTSIVDGLKVSEVENEFSVQQGAKIDTQMPKKMILPIKLGYRVDTGQAVWRDLADMPHMCVGGASGAGKSNHLKDIICQLLPKNVKLLLIDPKRSAFPKFSHLEKVTVCKSVESAKKELLALEKEFHRRQSFLEENQLEDISEYKGDDMPRIVVVFDEYFMFSMDKELEGKLVEIITVCRYLGIHVIVGTQRPSSKVLHEQLKANLPVTIAFAVKDSGNSRVLGAMSQIRIKG